ncbi:flagellar biosynthetic protein FliO [Clostridium sp. MSJ-11]|uniref:Flagellar biosynthetic protein FliO n=1 Tax=Clostridium mobile TaxID=2841512 RepID=A0ABS6EEX1_9CLOT|nr:flagellar biosynthetic protein FliO [Clostridium mobile]MBU5483025.1 flagellar biosynthetic protein FliO [Clostridium mobile]
MNGDYQFIVTLLKILIFLPFILLLIYTSLKMGGDKLQNIQNGRYMKILDRLPLSKDNAILAVKIGDKGYIVSSSNGKVEILFPLEEDELKKLESSKVDINVLQKLRKKEEKL